MSCGHFAKVLLCLRGRSRNAGACTTLVYTHHSIAERDADFRLFVASNVARIEAAGQLDDGLVRFVLDVRGILADLSDVRDL